MILLSCVSSTTSKYGEFAALSAYRTDYAARLAFSPASASAANIFTGSQFSHGRVSWSFKEHSCGILLYVPLPFRYKYHPHSRSPRVSRIRFAGFLMECTIAFHSLRLTDSSDIALFWASLFKYLSHVDAKPAVPLLLSTGLDRIPQHAPLALPTLFKDLRTFRFSRLKVSPCE